MGLRFNPVIVTDATTYSVKAYNSGVLHIFPDLTADITVTLPTPEDGLTYEFWYGGAAADAQDWIIKTGSDNSVYFIGGVVHMDEDAADAEVASVYSDGNSNSQLTVLTPASGTVLKLHSNGSNWYVNGMVVSASAAAAAFADQ
ncbi:hypothetical protein [Mesorhizobium sp. Z1-4]|uniref:hypothetical protein n=1 Tax=Mesorhizobium sp. Z1-4 TaxID=2448478 RepID=UPI000FD9F631|nr:hypothetical protein [Mesorhizobium sp. Z1-4]